MRLLAIETSCDETSVSVVELLKSSLKVLSNTTSSSARIHAATGGIIPEQAAREQIKAMTPVIIEAVLVSENVKTKSPAQEFETSRKIINNTIDGFAVTVGPGLIGSLLVGVEAAKTLSFFYKKPIFPVNHLLGHLYANFIDENLLDTQNIQFPFIGLIISGGHTDLLYFRSHTEYKWLGGTRDDAAGEAMDKIGRMLGIKYPAGQEMEKRARQSLDKFLRFQSPLLHDDGFDFSFSGLKTEAMRYVKSQVLNEQIIDSICNATQNAIVKVVAKKTVKALQKYKTNTLLIGGGVSANIKLREEIKKNAQESGIELQFFAPKPEYCADNAAMIGARALLGEKPSKWKYTKALPELYF